MVGIKHGLGRWPGEFSRFLEICRGFPDFSRFFQDLAASCRPILSLKSTPSGSPERFPQTRSSCTFEGGCAQGSGGPALIGKMGSGSGHSQNVWFSSGNTTFSRNQEVVPGARPRLPRGSLGGVEGCLRWTRGVPGALLGG